MKQRHLYTSLLYHIVVRTKHREHLISTAEQEALLVACFKKKAHELDAWVEEFGCWFDHVHILLRTGPSLPLSDVYRQLKGISTWTWNKQWPEQPFAWSDGVFVATADPHDCDALRHYIQNQKQHHEQKTAIPIWEPDDPA